MHTVELLEAAANMAAQLGYCVRRDWLAGQGGGACTVRGEKWLFLDLATDYAEQLDVVLTALRTEPTLDATELPDELATRLDRSQAA